MLRRAGFSVPIRARARGWGYIGADSTTRMVARGEVDQWSRVRSSSPAETLDAEARLGRPFLLTSSAEGERAGHMAVADRIHRIERDEQGQIAVLEYSGWEAGSKRASYGRRVWRLASIPGQGRGGLDRIEILEPKAQTGNQVYFPVDGNRPGASHYDRPSESTDVTQGSDLSSDINHGNGLKSGVLEGSK